MARVAPWVVARFQYSLAARWVKAMSRVIW